MQGIQMIMAQAGAEAEAGEAADPGRTATEAAAGEEAKNSILRKIGFIS